MFPLMSEASVRVIYKGKAVEDGSMDVRDLAPALLGIGDLCQNANHELNGDDVSASVRVTADFKRGSFDINLQLVQTLLDHVKDTLYGREHVSATDVLTLLGFLGVSVPGVFQFLKFLRKEKPKSVTTLENGNIRIENIHNSHITISPQVSQLANSQLVREAIPKVIEPLRKPGIDRLETRFKRRTIAVITKDDVPYLEPDEASLVPDIPLLDITTDAVLQVVRPSFEDKLKWTLTDGKNNYTLNVADERFKASVEAGELDFAAHDALRVKLHTTTRRNPRGSLVTEHEITEVVNVIRGPRGQHQTLLRVDKKSNESDEEN